MLEKMGWKEGAYVRARVREALAGQSVNHPRAPGNAASLVRSTDNQLTNQPTNQPHRRGPRPQPPGHRCAARRAQDRPPRGRHRGG
eukprot:76954-Chlamydomonas_euryale.AAC.1